MRFDKDVLTKTRKIAASISSEGLFGYVARLYNLGVYRLYAKRILMFPMLSRKVALVMGNKIALPSRWRGIKEELVLYGVHEPCATAKYLELLKPGDVVLDVGSNLGYYIAVADHGLEGNGEIHGFEPDEELCELARLNCSKLGAKCSVSMGVVSDTEGERDFYPSSISNWGSMLYRDDLRPQSVVRVRSMTVDSYCRTAGIRPSVIRMDIEGAEWMAVRGAAQTLSSFRPLIFMELHCAFMTKKQIAEIFRTLRMSGYSGAVWINRYYDVPWSTVRSKSRSVYSGTLSEFENVALAGVFPVVGAFFS